MLRKYLYHGNIIMCEKGTQPLGAVEIVESAEPSKKAKKPEKNKARKAVKTK